MRRTNAATARQAVIDIHRARRLLASARRRLARSTRSVDAQHLIVQAQYRWAHDLVRLRCDRLCKSAGVVGWGLGRVMEAGLPTGELCMTIFVRRKRSPQDLADNAIKELPRHVSSRGQRLRVDVVEVGAIELQVLVGTSMGPTVFAGEGTIGAFATDNATGRRVAITAMHVTGLNEFPNGGPAPQFVTPSTRRGMPTTPLGSLTFGTRTGLDAAKIQLAAPNDAASVVPGIGEIAGWRPVTFPGDENASVRLAGALSGVTRGALLYVDAAVPEIGLSSALVADIPSQLGDSGGPLVDAQNHVLGFLVGQATSGPFRNLRVFTPAAVALNVLQCEID